MNSLTSVVLVLIGSFLAAIAAFLIKKGMDQFKLSAIFSNKFLLGGVMIYGATTILYIIALTGGELSLLFPLASTTYIWSNLLAVKYLHEQMNSWKWFSVVGIIIGVLFIGLGS